MSFDTTKADRLRAKRLKLQKEAQAAKEVKVEATQEADTVKAELLQLTPAQWEERFKAQRQYGVPSTEGLNPEELKELARRQREAGNRNSPFSGSVAASQATDAAVGVGCLTAAAGAAVTLGAASAFFGFLDKSFKASNRRQRTNLRFGSWDR